MPTPPAAQRALLEARPLIRRHMAHQQWQTESTKGCSPILHPQPVTLAPPLEPIPRPDHPWPEEHRLSPTVNNPDLITDQVQPRVWFNLAIHPDHPPRAREYESFLRLMNGAHHGFIFEVAGNASKVDVRIGILAEEYPSIAIAGRALNLGLGDGKRYTPRLPTGCPGIIEFVPRPPYADAFTRLDELPHQPVGLIVQALAALPLDYTGLYQVCAEPVSDDRWAHNVQTLHDYRYRMLQEPAGPEGVPAAAWTQQVPSGNLPQLSRDTFTKTHPDRALYFALSRVAIWHDSTQSSAATSLIVCSDHDEAAMAHLRCLAAPMSLIRQNGRPLDHLVPDSLATMVGNDRLASMLENGQVHRHGVLLNSEELAAWVHMPPLEVVEQLKLINLRREPLIPEEPGQTGTRLGVCIDGDQRLGVCITPNNRPRHTSLVGRNGAGKSTLLQSMSLDDVQRGDGALIIDPHGELVRDFADRLPADAAKRAWWLDFEDPDHAVLFNPLRAGGSNQPPSRVADHFIGAFKAMTGGWGDRLEHILRNLITAVAQMPDGSLLDAATALERKGDRGEQTRRRLAEHCTDGIVRQFLSHLNQSYNNADLNPARHKLSKLLQSGLASLSMRQPDNRLDVPDWMERGSIVLVDLGPISGEFKHLVGSFLIATAYTAALARKKPSGGKLRPFHVVVDEAHRFSAPLLTGMVAETRKFAVGLTLAHQYLQQFPTAAVHALGTVETSVVFSVDSGDAEALAKSLQGRVDSKQIIALRDFEAYARLGTQPVHIHTPRYHELPKGAGQYEQIRARSLEHWYVPRKPLEARINALIEGRGTGASHTPPIMSADPVEMLPDDPNWPN